MVELHLVLEFFPDDSYVLNGAGQSQDFCSEPCVDAQLVKSVL